MKCFRLVNITTLIRLNWVTRNIPKTGMDISSLLQTMQIVQLGTRKTLWFLIFFEINQFWTFNLKTNKVKIKESKALVQQKPTNCFCFVLFQSNRSSISYTMLTDKKIFLKGHTNLICCRSTKKITRRKYDAKEWHSLTHIVGINHSIRVCIVKMHGNLTTKDEIEKISIDFFIYIS